jgi:uncharacterized protein (DUF2267 family)
VAATGLDVVDKSLQTTHVWLNEIMETLGQDRHLAWKALATVLHEVRDRVPASLAAHLGAELPLIVRGLYYDQYDPDRQPTRHDLDTCLAVVADRLKQIRPTDPSLATRAVMATLSSHVPRGQIEKIKGALPERLREFWTAAEEGVTPPPEQGEAGRYGRGAGGPDLRH